jgi:hypothetical protein
MASIFSFVVQVTSLPLDKDIVNGSPQAVPTSVRLDFYNLPGKNTLTQIS